MSNEIDKEFRRIREQLWEIKGHRCIYCKSEATQLHHIIPRNMGGDNRLSNIVPLCYECHLKAHNRKIIKPENYRKTSLPVPDNFNEVAEQYLSGEYTLKVAMQLTGMDHNRFYKYLHQYVEEYNKQEQFEKRRRISYHPKRKIIGHNRTNNLL